MNDADRVGAERRDVLERLRERGSGRTHWEGCEAEHLDCAAMKEIEQLRAALRWVADTSAMDYEYRAIARVALAPAPLTPVEP